MAQANTELLWKDRCEILEGLNYIESWPVYETGT
jgi:hypothetical protein